MLTGASRESGDVAQSLDSGDAWASSQAQGPQFSSNDEIDIPRRCQTMKALRYEQNEADDCSC